MTAPAWLTARFVDAQRGRLDELRVALTAGANTREADEAIVKDASNDTPGEPEDDAQKLDSLERDGLLVARNVARLVQVERALEKIREGTYGVSDVSGQTIPRERLEAVPEAVCTLAEEASYEARLTRPQE